MPFPRDVPNKSLQLPSYTISNQSLGVPFIGDEEVLVIRFLRRILLSRSPERNSNKRTLRPLVTKSERTLSVSGHLFNNRSIASQDDDQLRSNSSRSLRKIRPTAFNRPFNIYGSFAAPPPLPSLPATCQLILITDDHVVLGTRRPALRAEQTIGN